MKNFSDPETQKKLLDNIDLDYKKKTGENTWKDFKIATCMFVCLII